MALIAASGNFICLHRGLKFGKVIRTPGMQAGLGARRLRFRDIFRSSGTRVIYALNNI